MTQDECRDQFLALLRDVRERIRAIDAGTPFSAPMPAWWVDMADLEMNMGNMLRRHGRAATVGAMKGEDKA